MAFFGLINLAHAADMTGAEIKTFLSGKTAYLEATAGKTLKRFNGIRSTEVRPTGSKHDRVLER
jgi:hypothetical protein